MSQPSFFLGRTQEQDQFRRVLGAYAPLSWTQQKFPTLSRPFTKIRNLPEQPYIFLFYGPGGMGKTTLTRRLNLLTDQEFKYQFQTVLIDWERQQGAEPKLREGYDNIQPDTVLDILHKQLGKNLSSYNGKTYSAARDRLRDIEGKVEKALQSQTQEQGLNGDLLKLGSKGIAWIVRQQTGLNLVKPDDIARVLKVSAESLHQVMRFVDKALEPTERSVYQQPYEQLAEALGQEMQRVSQQKPLMIFLDTYEIVDRRACDYTLRQVIRSAGSRSIWVISGRSNLAESGQRGNRPFNGYSRDFSGDFLAVNPLTEFSRQEVSAYFGHMVPQFPLTEDQAQSIADFSRGIPFVVDRAAVMYREGKPIEEIVEPVNIELGKTTARDAVIRTTCERFLVHCFEQSDETDKQNDLRVIYALAMMRRPHANLLRAMIDEVDSLENRLEILQERYAFLNVDEIRLDEKLASFLRDYLRQEVRRTDPLVQQINETALAWLDLEIESASQGIEDTADWFSEEILAELLLDRVHHAGWQGEDTLWRYLMPRFIEAWQYSQTWAKGVLEVAEAFRGLNGKDSQQRLHWMIAALNKETRLEAIPKLLDESEKLERRQWLQPEHKLVLQFQRGRWHYLQDQNQMALSIYSRIEHQLLPNAHQLKKNLAEALYSLSGEFIWPNDSNNSIYSESGEIAIQKAIVLHPEPSVDYYYRQAVVEYGAKRYDEAIASYQKAIELDPSNAFPHNGLGNTYADLKRYDDAITSYQKSIELDPSNASPHNGLGNTYKALKRYDDAITSYQKSIELDPAYAKAYSNLGITYKALKRYDDAITSYQKSIKLEPKNCDYCSNLANVLMYQKRYHKAIINYEKSLELELNDYYTNNNLGWAYLITHQLDNAEKILEKAITTNDTDARCRFNLCIVLMNQGKFRQANELYHQALSVIDENDSEDKIVRAFYSFVLGKFEYGIAEMQALIADDVDINDLNNELNNAEMLATSPQPPERITEMITLLKRAIDARSD